MADFFDHLSEQHQQWIAEQRIFFVASAPLSGEGHINLSPKGYDTLRILDANTLAYLDMTGSGNETSAHIHENGRLTFMWCAFNGPAMILRAYGRGEVALPGSSRWDELAPRFTLLPGTRQIIINHVEKVQTSCGYAVPLMEFKAERETLKKYWVNKGEDRAVTYRHERNAQSLDGLPAPTTDASPGVPSADD